MLALLIYYLSQQPRATLWAPFGPFAAKTCQPRYARATGVLVRAARLAASGRAKRFPRVLCVGHSHRRAGKRKRKRDRLLTRAIAARPPARARKARRGGARNTDASFKISAPHLIRPVANPLQAVAGYPPERRLHLVEVAKRTLPHQPPERIPAPHPPKNALARSRESGAGAGAGAARRLAVRSRRPIAGRCGSPSRGRTEPRRRRRRPSSGAPSTRHDPCTNMHPPHQPARPHPAHATTAVKPQPRPRRCHCAGGLSHKSRLAPAAGGVCGGCVAHVAVGWPLSDALSDVLRPPPSRSYLDPLPSLVAGLSSKPRRHSRSLQGGRAGRAKHFPGPPSSLLNPSSTACNKCHRDAAAIGRGIDTATCSRPEHGLCPGAPCLLIPSVAIRVAAPWL